MRIGAYTRTHFMYPTHSIAALLLASAAAFATPSGLNNIPTADTTPQGTVVLQAFSTIGEERDADFNVGFKTGFIFKIVRFEVGADSHLLPGKGGPVAVNGKVSVPFGEGLPTFAIGAANVAFSESQRARAGDVFGYAVLSQDLGWLRIHGGCAWQDTDALPFFGVDKTFRLSKPRLVSDGKTTRVVRGGNGAGAGDSNSALVTRDLFTVRADAIEQRSHDWLFSAGVLVPITKFFVFETWGNFPSDGSEPSLTLKGNFVFSF